MDGQLKAWRENGKYLPDFLKDFHDQKDFFNFLHEKLKVEDHPYAKDINPIAGHCYVIDIFLWHLARYGYTLQKNRSKLNFEDLDTAIQEQNNKRNEIFNQILLASMKNEENEDNKNQQ